MTTWDELQNVLVTALQSSELPLGTIHAYPRWAPSWEEFLNLFSTEVDGREQVRGVEITRKVTESQWYTFGKSVKRTYHFILVFHLGLNDAGESGQELQNLCDQVMDYLDGYVIELSGYIYGPVIGPSRLVDMVETEFHGVLCNHAEIECPIEIAKMV